ncbi:MAG: membrane associated hydrolase [Bacteroidetes bacterium]|nr:MAG: membrane associated hydrolase [Bacteroidota bacterium]
MPIGLQVFEQEQRSRKAGWHILLGTLFLLSGFTVFANPADTVQRRIYNTTRISMQPKIDGNLNDSCWQTAEAARDFTQYMPECGKLSRFEGKVYVLYDDQAIYVAAQLYDKEPAKIGMALTPRDQRSGTVADNFIVSFDTYHDGLNGYRFEITAAGVQTDSRISPGGYDVSWDAVWESRAQRNNEGWALEMKIPYSAIRFPNVAEQDWGIQFSRTIQRLGEVSSWSPTDPKIENIVQQWGQLNGLRDIKPPLRLSFTPYVAGYAERLPESYDPPAYINSYHASGGMDIKYGINESFTLDATLIPDFGQVQSDNRVLNLSPFEVRYQERRPFFTEGTELFGKSEIFYSRRIGGQPLGYYDPYYQLGPNEELEKNPSLTQLYNATKLSGRTRSGLGIGVLNAVAAPAFAVVKDTLTGVERDIQTGALTNYNVLVLDQNLPNNSSATFSNTSTIRDALARDANVSEGAVRLNNKKNTYRLLLDGRFSHVDDPFYDDSLSNGYVYVAQFAKTRGKFQFDFGQYALSNNWDPSDLGILNGYNLINNNLQFRWLDYEAKKHIQSWNASLKGEYIAQMDPMAYQSVRISSSENVTFTNFSSAGVYMQTIPAWYFDYYEPRIPGKKLWHAPFVYFLPYFNTDQRKPVQWFIQIEYAESPVPKDPLFGGATSFYWRVSDRFNFTLFTEATKDHNNFGYAGYDPSRDMVTIGRRHINVTNNELSMEYNMTPRMGMTFRARHYWSKVVYNKFYELRNDGGLEPIDFIEGRDLNFNVFNIDLVYNWQFAPGSYLSVIWKNNIGQSDSKGQDDYFVNFNKTMNTPQANSLILKMIYYLDWQKIRSLSGKA